MTIRRGRQTSSRKSRQLRNRYGKVRWILSKTGLSTHAAREISGSPQTRADSNFWFVGRDCQRKSRQVQVPADFYEQAVRDKLTFSCKEDNYKLKLYDEGATPSLEKAVKILSLKEERKRELQESKTPEIESFTTRGNRSDLVTDQDTEQRNQRGSKRKHFGTVVTADMPLGGGTAQLRIPDVANAINWDISLSHARVYLQKQSTKFSKLKMPLAPHSWEGLPHLFQYFHGRTSCKPSNW